MTDGTKTCWASEGREKARRWRSIPTTETLDTLVIVHSFARLGVEIILLYLLVSTRAVVGQFSGPYSPVRPAEI